MKSTEIIKKKAAFKEITWRHLANCLKAFETKEFMAASIWSAVFVESLLKDILFEISGASLSTEEISALISRLKNQVNNGSKCNICQADKIALEDIIRRSDEVRLKRNRLVHDTGIENKYLESDAEDIFKNINQIIDRYLQTELCSAISEKDVTEIEEDGTRAEATFSMFISTITPHSFEQTEFIEAFCEKLKDIGVKPVRCFLNDFDKRNPMEKVCRAIADCHGIIIIGLERSHVYYFKDREGSEKESESIHRYYSSAWLQLEAGMAIGMGKEVFVLCQKDLYSDGIFDRDWNSFTPMEIALPLSVDDPKVVATLNAIKSYKSSRDASFATTIAHCHEERPLSRSLPFATQIAPCHTIARQGA